MHQVDESNLAPMELAGLLGAAVEFWRSHKIKNPFTGNLRRYECVDMHYEISLDKNGKVSIIGRKLGFWLKAMGAGHQLDAANDFQIDRPSHVCAGRCRSIGRRV